MLLTEASREGSQAVVQKAKARSLSPGTLPELGELRAGWWDCIKLLSQHVIPCDVAITLPKFSAGPQGSCERMLMAELFRDVGRNTGAHHPKWVNKCGVCPPGTSNMDGFLKYGAE